MTGAFNGPLLPAPEQQIFMHSWWRSEPRATDYQSINVILPKKGQPPVSRERQPRGVLIFGERERKSEREKREKETHSSPTSGQTAPDRIVGVPGELWNIPIMAYKPLI